MWDTDSSGTSLADGAAQVERAMAAAAEMSATFSAELDGMRQSMTFAGREVGAMSTRFGSTLKHAFDGVMFDGMKLSDALKGVARSMADTVYAIAMKPVQDAMGGAVAAGMSGMLSGAMPFAAGGAFSQGRLMPFAKGGVVSSPTAFAMRGGTGLMGEAGPEAIMPLTRGADGRLGVRAAGGGRPVNVTVNVSTPDVAGFARSQSQIAAQVTRALARGERNR